MVEGNHFSGSMICNLPQGVITIECVGLHFFGRFKIQGIQVCARAHISSRTIVEKFDVRPAEFWIRREFEHCSYNTPFTKFACGLIPSNADYYDRDYPWTPRNTTLILPVTL